PMTDMMAPRLWPTMAPGTPFGCGPGLWVGAIDVQCADRGVKSRGSGTTTCRSLVTNSAPARAYASIRRVVRVLPGAALGPTGTAHRLLALHRHPGFQDTTRCSRLPHSRQSQGLTLTCNRSIRTPARPAQAHSLDFREGS